MIKKISFAFVALMLVVIAAALSTIALPNLKLLITIINWGAVGLLLLGISLIITLICDRYRDYKNEGDDYKKY